MPDFERIAALATGRAQPSGLKQPFLRIAFMGLILLTASQLSFNAAQ